MIWKTFKWDYLKKSPDTSGSDPISGVGTISPEDAKVFKALKVNLPTSVRRFLQIVPFEGFPDH